MKRTVLALSIVIGACGGGGSPPPVTPVNRVAPAPAAPAPTITLSIIGTNDLHGAITRLPVFAGFVANLRAARAADHGAVILVDAGDLFQGTIESNQNEGAAVIRAYNAIGYDAAAVGNHEFDYGPVGPDTTAVKAGEDPRGALIANMAAAKFPFLSANIVDAATHAAPTWPSFAPSTMVDRAGLKIGIIGASTEATPHTTMPANFVGLQMTPTAAAITREAAILRAAGAQVVIVTAHLGSSCKDLTHSDDDSSCDHDQELYSVLHELAPGTIDVMVAGHTHAGVAHTINGVAVIESFSSARAFGRVDLAIDVDGKVRSTKISPPHELCAGEHRGQRADAPCTPGDYEGRPVTPDPAVAAVVDEALAGAAKLRDEPLGTATLTALAKRSYDKESAVGNLFADLMRAAHPEAAVALTNGGGLRADLAAGPLTYGALYEAMPFDNRYALVSLTGAQLEGMVAANLASSSGVYSWSGMTAVASCVGPELHVKLAIGGKPVSGAKSYTIVTSDYLASGGSDVFKQLAVPATAVQVTDVVIRESLADQLRKLHGAAAKLDPKKLFDPSAPRLKLPSPRPVHCAPTTAPANH